MGFHAWHEGQSEEAFLEECRASKKYRSGVWYVLVDSDQTFLSKLIVYPLDAIGMGNTKGLASIATPPFFQGRGYASTLIREVIRNLTDEGVEHLILFSDISPAYYEKFGFRPLPNRFQSRDGSVCMVRTDSYGQWDNDLKLVPPSYF